MIRVQRERVGRSVAERASAADVRIAMTASELDIQDVSGDPRVFGGVTRVLAEGVPDLLEVARARAGADVAGLGLVPDDIALVS